MSQTNPLVDLSNALAEAAEKAGKATVLVNARQRMPASGIAFGADLVLTADHTVEREEDISVMLFDKSEVAAQLAGRDPTNDLAVLRLNKASAPVAEPVETEGRVGQLVLALGRPSPDGIEASLGVVSAVGGPVRTAHGGLLERYLRTDTTAFPGFSGGPLIDAAGRVLGMNTSGLARGLLLTIPTGTLWPLAAALAQHGSIRRGYLGIRSQPVELPSQGKQALGRQQETGLLLVGVESDSPAAAGGLMVGDILVGLGGQTVKDPDELAARLTGGLVGAPTPVEVLRGGKPVSLSVTIGERK